jgi:diguanylate cyclase (GGDEF)-like protein
MLRARACSFAAGALLAVLLLLSAGESRAQTLEQRVQAIEQLNITSPWRESAALIEGLGEDRAALSAEQEYRLLLVELRNRALAGDYTKAMQQAESLLAREAPPQLRIRALSLAVNLTTNVSDYPTAFAWLREGLSLLEQIDDPQPRLLGMASYLYLRVGEERPALDYAQQSLDAARLGGTARDECVALSDYSNALDEIGHSAQAESLRQEQIEVCGRAGDPVFIADGYKGVGKALLRQGLPRQALPWLENAIERFDAAGFTNGSLETGVWLAEALLRSDGSLEQASKVLEKAVPVFDVQKAWDNIEHSRRLMSEVAERQGRASDALEQLRLSVAARTHLQEDARERRLTYLQMQFDTQAKVKQISQLESERQRQTAEIAARSRTQWLQGLGLLSLMLVAALLVSVLLRTVTDRRRYRELSERDGLTGLYNHQSTLRLGLLLQQRSRVERRPFTAIVADIDRFKQINDRYGHATGDAVLRRLGQHLQEVFPAQAVLGRSGGEEFTMLLDCGIEQARFLVEDLRRRIEPLDSFGERIEYSLSYGLCEAIDSHAPLEDILRSADLALYQAKRGGRNRVVDAATLHGASTPESGLVVVGSGIQLGRHLSPRCLSEIEEAECVFALTDGAAHAMLAEMRPDLIDLRIHYAVGKDRRQTYREMDAAIMAEVRAGKRVCAVFYGHPGVFADVPHAVIRKAREAGFSARMEPGISAEACLYADLGIDPGRSGVQSIEATQFLLEDRQIDTRNLLLLWQVALTGDTACTRFHAVPEELDKLVVRLLLDYPADHEVILYEAARLSVEPFRADRIALRDIAGARYEEYTTLVIPPCPPQRPGFTSRLLQTMRAAGAEATRADLPPSG